MRRFLAILLIALVPLHAASALVGTVSGAQPPQLVANHDPHDQQPDEACAGLAQVTDHSPCHQEPDDHCSNCHGGCCAPLGSVLPSTIARLGDAIILAAVRGKPSAPLARPERPKWIGLA